MRFKWSIIFVLLLPSYSIIRIGHLYTDEHEKDIINVCSNKSMFQIKSLKSCNKYNGLENAAALHYSYDVHVIMGAPCEEEAETISRLSLRWGTVYFSTSSTTTLEREASTITMSSTTDNGLAMAFEALCHHLKWTEFAVVHSAMRLPQAEAISNFFESRPYVNVSATIQLESEDWVYGLLNSARAVMFCGTVDDFLYFLEQLAPATMRYSEFSIFIVEEEHIASREFYERSAHFIIKSENKRLKKILRSTYLFQQSGFAKKKIEEFAFRNQFPMDKSLSNSLVMCDILYLLRKLRPNIDMTQTNISAQIMETVYDHYDYGFTGEIYISPSGERLPFYDIHWYDGQINTTVAVVAAGPLKCVEQNENASFCSHMFIRGGPRSQAWFSAVPPWKPMCGFDGSECSNKHIFVSAGIVIVILSIPLSLAWYLQRREYELQRMPWRVPFEEVHFLEDDLSSKPTRRCSLNTGSQSMSIFTGKSLIGCRYGYIRGQKVIMHTFIQRRPLSFTRKEMEMLNYLKGINHPNINGFRGLTFNYNTELLIMWNYCTRHSLEELFFVKEQRFGRNFLSSFLKHILKGIQYIHSGPIRFHGNLFMSNCVVDAYWVVKLTDFGVRPILNEKMNTKEIQPNTTLDVENLPFKCLQLPPEYLDEIKATTEYPLGTVCGDIYQIGMIIYQVLFGLYPFKDCVDTIPELISKIEDPSLTIPFRPTVPEKTDYTLRLLSIMQQCWLHKPSTRPTLSKIHDAVQREFGLEQKGTLIDSMIAMIDEYSFHLEQIVEQRTREIETLNIKTEKLLYQIMPKTVADELREGRAVKPQLHHSVSVLFADVCGFTAICEQSIPVQIITMLNLLYSTFDQIIAQYHAFKVENVGDAYLIVSGIPELEDYLHLAEVCKIAIMLQKFVTEEYVVPHRRGYKLRVKVGIHTGALASGILGSTAPRFCVFGDTVNMASRMAAMSDPGKIQVSETASVLILNKFPEFNLRERGLVDIKGKGPCPTYWLETTAPDTMPI